MFNFHLGDVAAQVETANFFAFGVNFDPMGLLFLKGAALIDDIAKRVIISVVEFLRYHQPFVLPDFIQNLLAFNV